MALVVVSGAIANKLHQGGEAWVRLSYVLGLRRLGYRVHLLEQISREACVDEHGDQAPIESSANRAYFKSVMKQFGLTDCATLIPTDNDGHANIEPAFVELAESADVLLNISGHLALVHLRMFRNKIFLDIDPGYTQFWHSERNSGARLAGHDSYFTIGENIGRPDCPIPTCGIGWRPTRPPVVLSEWPATLEPAALRFTTIANWRGSYGGVQFGGKTYGLKVHEFRKIIKLPAQSGLAFEIALNIHPGDHKDLAALECHAWRITDPLEASSTPDRFRRYIQESGAEFSVAQGIYVDTNSGWFSDRTARYLASGKPALVQETGFSRHIPAGRGLISFRTLDEAVAGAESIAGNYASHSRAAREIAEAYFDSDRVLGQMMKEVGVAP